MNLKKHFLTFSSIALLGIISTVSVSADHRDAKTWNSLESKATLQLTDAQLWEHLENIFTTTPWSRFNSYGVPEKGFYPLAETADEFQSIKKPIAFSSFEDVKAETADEHQSIKLPLKNVTYNSYGVPEMEEPLAETADEFQSIKTKLPKGEPLAETADEFQSIKTQLPAEDVKAETADEHQSIKLPLNQL